MTQVMAVAVATLAVARAAMAQPGPGLGAPLRLNAGEETKAIGVAECVLAHDRRSLDALMRIAPEAGNASVRWSRVMPSVCAAGDRRPPDVAELRGAMFIVLYRDQAARSTAIGPNGGPQVADFPTGSYEMPLDHLRRRALVARAVGHDPALARALVLSEEGSYRRQVAMRAFMSSLRDSLTLDDGTEHFRQAVLAGLVAEILYLKIPLSDASGDRKTS